MTSEVVAKEDTNLLNEKNTEKSAVYLNCFHFPKAVYFILITELCERFNYYGMRTILIIYLTQHLLIKTNNAVSIYHLFISLCYFSPIIGSFISDNYLGKFRTIMILGSLYTLGSALMSLTSIPSVNLTGPMISLLLIAFGTGGIKVCVGPFGGDQIPEEKKILLDSYFSMFYFGINLGALVSTIVTPILRADVYCNGSKDCYPLAFGVPAILMGFALLIFLLGNRFYNHVPVKDNIYMKTMYCFITAVRNWCRERKNTPDKELLEYASPEYSYEFINDLRTILRIAVLYLPLPVFWALYEQMGSRWTLQAANMDGEISEKIIILPDQMSILNVILVIIFIPVFDSCIYPIIYRIHPHWKPLRRMTIGITFTCLAFVAAFFLQRSIESYQPLPITAGAARIFLVNSHSCNAFVHVIGGPVITANGYQTSTLSIDMSSGNHQFNLTYSKCPLLPNDVSELINVNLVPLKVNFLIAGIDGTNKLSIQSANGLMKPNLKGYPSVALVSSDVIFNAYSFQLRYASNGFAVLNVLVNSANNSLYTDKWNYINKPGRYIWFIKDIKSNASSWVSVPSSNGSQLSAHPIKLASSEVVMFLMIRSVTENTIISIPMVLNHGSSISIMWQFPQYLLVTIGEILVSITGLSFSYDQAPNGMKALVNAFWFLTTAFGNVIVIIVAKMELVKKQSSEYLIFGILCAVFNVLFAILAFRYKPCKKEDYEQITNVSDKID